MEKYIVGNTLYIASSTFSIHTWYFMNKEKARYFPPIGVLLSSQLLLHCNCPKLKCLMTHLSIHNRGVKPSQEGRYTLTNIFKRLTSCMPEERTPHTIFSSAALRQVALKWNPEMIRTADPLLTFGELFLLFPWGAILRACFQPLREVKGNSLASLDNRPYRNRDLTSRC